MRTFIINVHGKHGTSLDGLFEGIFNIEIQLSAVGVFRGTDARTALLVAVFHFFGIRKRRVIVNAQVFRTCFLVERQFIFRQIGISAARIKRGNIKRKFRSERRPCIIGNHPEITVFDVIIFPERQNDFVPLIRFELLTTGRTDVFEVGIVVVKQQLLIQIVINAESNVIIPA